MYGSSNISNELFFEFEIFFQGVICSTFTANLIFERAKISTIRHFCEIYGTSKAAAGITAILSAGTSGAEPAAPGSGLKIPLRAGLTAISAELAGVYCAAGADPAGRFGLAAFRAEFAGVYGAAGACPFRV